MKKFTYQLETVLNHRKLMEEAEQLGLARISRDLAREGEVLESQVNQHRALSEELAHKERTQFDIHESALYREFLGILEHEIDATVRRIKGLEAEFVRKREELVRATRNRKVLDTHKGRELSRFTYEEERAEQKRIDEITSIRQRPRGDD